MAEADTAAAAKKLVKDRVGFIPDDAKPLPGPVLLEVERLIVEGDEGDEEEEHDVEVTPDSETLAMLWALDLATSPTEAAGPQCDSTADDEDDEEVRCELLEGHKGEHAGAGLVWK